MLSGGGRMRRRFSSTVSTRKTIGGTVSLAVAGKAARSKSRLPVEPVRCRIRALA